MGALQEPVREHSCRQLGNTLGASMGAPRNQCGITLGANIRANMACSRKSHLVGSANLQQRVERNVAGDRAAILDITRRGLSSLGCICRVLLKAMEPW